MGSTKKPWSRTLVLALALWLAGVSGAGAQGSAPPAGSGLLVKAVQFEGARVQRPENLRSRVKTRVGKPLNRADAYEDVNRLFRLGPFAYVDVSIESDPDGVRVVFRVDEKPMVHEIRFEGRSAIPEVDLLDALTTKEDELLSEYALKLDTDEIREQYLKDGYLFVEVRVERVDVDEGVEVVFRIDEGPKTRVERISFAGNQTFPKEQLLKYLETEETGWLGWINPGLWDHDVFESDLERLRGFYHSEGFLDASVVVEDLIFNSDRSRLELLIRVREGKRYQVRRIAITGMSLFPETLLREKLKLHEGDTFAGRTLQEDLKAIERLYGEKAYIFAEARFTLDYAAQGNQVDLNIQIKEGHKIYVDRIHLAGNPKTREMVARREISLYPGEPYDSTELEESIARINALRLFKPLDPLTALDFEPGDREDMRNLKLNVEEDQTGLIQFGGGIASNVGPFGNLSYTQRNFDLTDLPRHWTEAFTGDAFVGGGQTVSLQASPGVQRSVYRFLFVEPYLFNRPYSLTEDVFLYERDRGEYAEQRIGAHTTVGRRFQRYLNVDLTYDIEEISLFDVEIDAPDDVIDYEGSFTLSSLTLGAGWYRDKLDPRALIPYQGYRLTGSYEYAGNQLLGELDFSKAHAGYAHYITLYKTAEARRIIGSLETRGGWAEENGRLDEVPIFSRFFVGGPHSLRGFDYRGIGPTDRGVAIGGTLYTTASAEVSAPLYQDVLRVAVYQDFGNLGERPEDWDLKKFRSAYGLGLYIYVPIFPNPIELDYGIPIWKEPGDDTRAFNFTISAGAIRY